MVSAGAAAGRASWRPRSATAVGSSRSNCGWPTRRSAAGRPNQAIAIRSKLVEQYTGYTDLADLFAPAPTPAPAHSPEAVPPATPAPAKPPTPPPAGEPASTHPESSPIPTPAESKATAPETPSRRTAFFNRSLPTVGRRIP